VRGWSVENLHAYRTNCKRIRYLAEMAGETPEASRVVEPLQRIQDAVGEWHDWQTLTEAAEKMFGATAESALIAALRNMTNEKFAAARTVCQESRRVLLARYRTMLKDEREKKAVAPRKPSKSAAVTGNRSAVA
jgi:CHAD domain-containing protein